MEIFYSFYFQDCLWMKQHYLMVQIYLGMVLLTLIKVNLLSTLSSWKRGKIYLFKVLFFFINWMVVCWIHIHSSLLQKLTIHTILRDTEASNETPYTFSTSDTFYSVTNMVTLMDYEVFVSVNTIDFGQSEWSEALYFTTTDMSYSELAEIDNLLDTVVRFMNYFDYRGSPPYARFGTWKKPCYMKLVLVGLYCGPLLTLISPLTRT